MSPCVKPFTHFLLVIHFLESVEEPVAIRIFVISRGNTINYDCVLGFLSHNVIVNLMCHIDGETSFLGMLVMLCPEEIN
jgi:hypothetical protein